MDPYHFQILHVPNTGSVGSQSLKVGWFILFITKREAKDYFDWFLFTRCLISSLVQNGMPWHVMLQEVKFMYIGMYLG